jgi:glycosyltransferase involved in cell wall biosynthesis
LSAVSACNSLSETDVRVAVISVQDLDSIIRSGGNESIIVTPYYNGSRPVHVRRLGGGRRTGFRFLLALLLNIFRLYRFLKIQHSAIDTVIANDAYAAFAGRLAMRGKKRVILVTHFEREPWNEFVAGGFLNNNTVVYFLLLKLTKYALRLPGLEFIHVSKANREFFKKIIDNRVPAGQVIYQAPAIASRPGNPSGYILNAGTIDARKNQRILPALANELRKLGMEIPFVLAGKRTAAESRLINERITEFQQQANFQFADVLALPDVYERMNRATLYLHVAKSESYGRTLVEAIINGTPVLALDFPAAWEILSATPEAVLPQSIPMDELARKVHYYFTKPEVREQLWLRQSAWVEAHFSHCQMVDKFSLLLA